MKNKVFYVLAIPFLIFLTNCQIVQNKAQAKVSYPLSYGAFPEVPFELPEPLLDNLTGILLGEEDDFNTQQIDITDNFRPADYHEFSLPDPKLFANDNKLVIDLYRLRQEEYSFPLPGAKLISEYAGKRVRHTGVDLKVSRRDTVLAAFDGIVRMSKRNSTYGNVIVIRHYNGLETLYSHNTQNMVKVGDRVQAGQPIATTGQTGRASTDHLHFEVRVNGQHFNPALVFDFNNQQLNVQSLLCVKEGTKVKVYNVDPFPLQAAYQKDEDDQENS
ncbi:MAG: M23 family metallopeptidase [Tannerellaceae bacterium]|nr:M23 family metallopeptidase [Tannerellaceae bacterium]